MTTHRQAIAQSLNVVKSLAPSPDDAPESTLADVVEFAQVRKSCFTDADAARLTAESATWPLPCAGVVDTVLGADFRVWRNDTFNMHSATVLTQIERMGARARTGKAARDAIEASERERMRVQGSR